MHVSMHGPAAEHLWNDPGSVWMVSSTELICWDLGVGSGCGAERPWMLEAQIPVPPFSTNFHNLLAPQFPHLQTGNSSIYFRGLVCQ